MLLRPQGGGLAGSWLVQRWARCPLRGALVCALRRVLQLQVWVRADVTRMLAAASCRDDACMRAPIAYDQHVLLGVGPRHKLCALPCAALPFHTTHHLAPPPAAPQRRPQDSFIDNAPVGFERRGAAKGSTKRSHATAAHERRRRQAGSRGRDPLEDAASEEDEEEGGHGARSAKRPRKGTPGGYGKRPRSSKQRKAAASGSDASRWGRGSLGALAGGVPLLPE